VEKEKPSSRVKSRKVFIVKNLDAGSDQIVVLW
jgi:hypothetical protein